MTDIVGIGIDLIDLEHFRLNYSSEDAELLERCFTKQEITAAGSGQNRLARLAVRFAAKEAAFKALGGASGIALTEIEVIPRGSGAPELHLYGGAKKLAQQCGATQFLVSLTHSVSSAAAVVVALSG